MDYVVTARKWRPIKFDEVVGQEHITTTLKNALKQNRIAHAYIFTGPRGVGKTTTARILAKTLNCLNPVNNEPCNECDICNSIQSGQTMDIIEIDGASNRGIDEIRTLRDSVKYAPTVGKYKVYIIDEVHMLTKESFNAFLKTLEEPPPHTIFIFATTDIQKVPLTIISRCQRFDFRRIQLDTIKELLKKIAIAEKIEIDDRTLTIIAKKADGALRDAESYFDQVISFCGNKIDNETVIKMLNLIDDEIFFVLSDAVLEKDFKKAFEVSGLIYNNGWSYVDFLDGLIEHFRNIMTVVLTEKAELIETAEIYKTRYLKYYDQFSEGDIIRLLNFLNKSQQELRYSQNQKLKIEISLTTLIALEKTDTISKLVSEIGNGQSGSSEKPKLHNVSHVTPPRDSGKKLNENENTTFSGAASKAFVNTVSDQSKVTNFTKAESKSTSHADYDINSITAKWEGFAKTIIEERSLTLGSVFSSARVVGFDKNRISISSEDSHGPESVNLYQDFITKKALQYFGKRVTVECIYSANQPEKEVRNIPDNDPYINAIRNELGGERIS